MTNTRRQTADGGSGRDTAAASGFDAGQGHAGCKGRRRQTLFRASHAGASRVTSDACDHVEQDAIPAADLVHADALVVAVLARRFLGGVLVGRVAVAHDAELAI